MSKKLSTFVYRADPVNFRGMVQFPKSLVRGGTFFCRGGGVGMERGTWAYGFWFENGAGKGQFASDSFK